MPATTRLAATCLVAVLTLSAPAARAAFVCPVKPPPASKPLPDLAGTLKAYDDPRDDATLAKAIASLKGESMPDGEIVDHVVAAYCPKVNAVASLSDADKTALVARFAAELAQAVYTPVQGRVDAILLDVPVSPDLYGRIKIAADKAGVTRDAWIARALQAAAAAP